MAIRRDSALDDKSASPLISRPWVLGEDGKVDLFKEPAKGEQPDHFAVLGVPRRLLLDPQHLEVRFRSLVRDLHPDRYHVQGPEAVAAAQKHTSRVNDAWRVLRDLEKRCAYVVELEGGGDKYQPPPAFLADVMERNELLDDLQPALKGDPATAKSARWQLKEQAGELEELQEESVAKLRRAAKDWDAAQTSGDPDDKAAARKALAAALGQLRTLSNLTERVRSLLEASPAPKGMR